VGAALGSTLLGVAAFGIRHCRFLSKLASASWFRCDSWPVLEKTRLFSGLDCAGQP
jgi:hypothetical protein